MALTDYPTDVRADYPERSSRGWAVLTILWIKGLALIPHIVVLVFLGIAQFVVAFIAQFVVAFKGEYPAGMHTFVTGVLRWSTRVSAFFLSVTDRYPPFSLQPDPDYPVDVVVERPAQPSRAYAAFTIVVQILAFIGFVWFLVWLADHADTLTSSTNGYQYRYNLTSWYGSGLLLRQLAALPHYIIVGLFGIVVFILWFIVQWVILFVARFPRGMWDLVAGYVRWYVRVNAYALGLVDRYPPFSVDPSLTAAAPPAPPAPAWPATPPAPPAQQPSAAPPPPPAQPAGPPQQAQPPQPSTPPAQAAPPPQSPDTPASPGQPQPPATPPQA